MINIIPANSAMPNGFIKTLAFRERFPCKKDFIAMINGQPVGLVSFDEYPTQNDGWVQLIYVLPEFRKNRVGSELLEYIETHAISRKLSSIGLDPKAVNSPMHLDAQFPDSLRLEQWYASKGYVASPKGSMHKSLL